ncbi:hypothetical protein B0H11DRAFT_1980761 [Mycena galericulata]|nr:hypothetical protein B0H11DRAFT_1980761 [Mycena galericulata]
MDPVLESIVNSNEPPTEVQAQGLRLLLGTAIPNLDTLEETIPSSSVLSDLVCRSRRTGFVAALAGALSLIRIIPAEILSEIFLICRDQNLEYHYYSVVEKTDAPLVLTLVSSRWRAICLSDPRLWDHIHLNNLTAMPPPVIIRQLLERSGHLPLDVRLKIFFKETSRDRSPQIKSFVFYWMLILDCSM